jgi:hypothetical protein
LDHTLSAPEAGGLPVRHRVYDKFKKKPVPAVQLLSSRNEPNESKPASAIVKYQTLMAELIPIHDLTISLNFIAREDYDRRAICYERTVRTSLKSGCEFAPIKKAGITFKSSLGSRPYLPGDMRDVIFDAATGSLRRITPIVFGDELFQTPLLRMRWKVDGLGRDPAPLAGNLPLILGCHIQIIRLNAVLHRKAYIVFPIEQAGGGRDGAPGHDLGNEDNSSSIIAAFLATNVEAQVYLVKVGVKRDRETPEELGAAEPKTDQAYVGSSLE